MNKQLLLAALSFIVFSTQAQNVGIGTNDPKSKLDIQGNISLREGSALALSNGNNDNIALTGNFSFYRITGPTAAFSINGIVPVSGADGQLVTLVNTTSQILTIKNEAASSTAANRFTVAGGSDLVSVAGGSSVTIQYNKTTSRWYVTASQNFTVTTGAIATGDITTGNTAITLTNNTGRLVGNATMTVEIKDNAVNQKGLALAPTNLNSNQAYLTDINGNPTWAKIPNTHLNNSSINVASGGAGISVSGSPVALGGTVTVTNTGDTDAADDITTSSTAGGDLSGPFSNLNINAGTVGTNEIANGGVANVDLVNSSVTINTGTGLSGGGTVALGGTLNLVNTAPDQTVSITGGGINSVSGSYPNFTITGTEADGSVTNEGALTVGAGTASTSIINSNTSGSTPVTLQEGSNITLTESGNTITIASANSGGTVTNIATGTGLTGGPITGTGTISIANVGTAGTYTKVTTNAQGQVISGTTLNAGDIPNLAGDVTGAINNAQVVDDSHNHTELEAKGQYTWSASTNPRDFPQAISASFVRASDGWPEYGSVVNVGTYPNDGGTLQLYAPYAPAYGGNSLRYRLGVYNNAGWTGWKTIWDDTNDGPGSGMNADMTDGFHASQSIVGNNIVVRNASGYIMGNYINTTDNVVGSGVTGIVVKQGDNYHRTATAAAVLSFLGVTAPAGDNLGNHTATTTLAMGTNAITSSAGTRLDGNGGWVRSYGNTGWYNGTYAGGWYMADATWIRSYGSKDVYINTFLRADGGIASGGIGSPGAGNIGFSGTHISASTAAFVMDAASQTGSTFYWRGTNGYTSGTYSDYAIMNYRYSSLPGMTNGSMYVYSINFWDDYWYYDVLNDLDAIDNMKPMYKIDKKTGIGRTVTDPASMPSFLVTKDSTGEGYYKDIPKLTAFSIGAIRQLRAESKTATTALDARVDRLESLVSQLTGKALGELEFTVAVNAYKGMTNYVVIDARITAKSYIKIDGLTNYEIVKQGEGSFEVKFTTPPAQDTKFTYSSKF